MPAFSLLSNIISAGAWQRFSLPSREPHPASLVALAVLSGLSAVLFEWTLAGEDRAFQLYGVNSVIAGSAISIALMGMAAPLGRRASGIAIGLGLSILTSLVLSGLALSRDVFLLDWSEANAIASTGLSFATLIVVVIWSIGAFATALGSLASEASIRPVGRAIAAVVGTFVALALLPTWPIFTGKDFTTSTANIWELISAATADNEPDPRWVQRQEIAAAIEMAQPAAMEEAIGNVAARREGEDNIFVLGVAGSNTETVFATELQASVEVVGHRLGTTNRSILLVNPAKTFPSTLPIASVSNISAALRAIGKRMDKDRDAALLVLTSHGDKTGFSLAFGSLVQRTLTPFALKAMLDSAEIKNRIIVVSACYSGVFVPELADENTVVITASSATTNSFGCSNERDWTYFGDAFFNQALRTAPTLSAAFEKAKELVGEWERRDGLTSSQPQIHVGDAIGRHFPIVGRPSNSPAASAAAVASD
ncbi:C13 family peptidase [Bosea sp. BH3]|uniref:C13 family peptidase n=1 Tax=Bosea sp. BH3 TaxID=2871701 RepID=UPI0021CB1972|nr:C13 family peptidase [Bosea sp. BH3]MCU4181238.1 C13 family peptidase [Bosea sp. BH3]